MALISIPSTGGNVRITPTRERTTVTLSISSPDGDRATVTLNRSEANALSKSLARAVER